MSRNSVPQTEARLCCENFDAMQAQTVVQLQPVVCAKGEHCAFRQLSGAVDCAILNPHYCTTHRCYYCAYCVDRARRAKGIGFATFTLKEESQISLRLQNFTNLMTSLMEHDRYETPYPQ